MVSSSLLTWIALTAIVCAMGVAGRWSRVRDLPRVQSGLDACWAPVVAGVVTSVFLAWIWGSLAAPSVIHDEAAYLLQAEIFASGRLSGSPPPLPEFFEQYHVFVTPRLAPKYPPGHALLLVPGIWLGLSGLVPIVLHGISGALVFALARRLDGAWTALLAWLIWLSAPTLDLWRCTYLSQSTSTALWLAALWQLLRWRDRGETRNLVTLAILVAWLAVTRPLTALALAAPVGLVVVVCAWKQGAFRSMAIASAAGLGILAVLPIWAQVSTGRWDTNPYSEYSRVYFPSDTIGFGASPARSQRELPPDMQSFNEWVRQLHATYLPSAVPRAFLSRVIAAAREQWGGAAWREPLVLFFFLGLGALDRRGWFAILCACAPFFAYLCYAQHPEWPVYYHEIQPVLSFGTALGLVRALGWLASTATDPTPIPPPLPAAAAAVFILCLGVRDAMNLRGDMNLRYAYVRGFARALTYITEPRSMVFVRYAIDHNPHHSLIENPPDYEDAPIWLVRDRGLDNERLIALAPERVPYLFDEATFVVQRLTSP